MTAAAARTKSDQQPGGVYTLRVAVRLLNEIANSTEPVRITDLANRLEMSLPTVSRHVATWRELGFVERAPGSDAVRLGTKLIALGRAARVHNPQVDLSRPVLSRLRAELSQTVVLVARIENVATALLCFSNLKEASIVVRPGGRFDLPYSPSGRLLWVLGTPAEERAQLQKTSFDFSAEHGLNKTTFAKKLAHVIEHEYDYSVEVKTSGIGAVSCPIFNPNGTCNASVTVMIPSRFLSDPPAATLLSTVKAAASKISELLRSGDHAF